MILIILIFSRFTVHVWPLPHNILDPPLILYMLLQLLYWKSIHHPSVSSYDYYLLKPCIFYQLLPAQIIVKYYTTCSWSWWCFSISSFPESYTGVLFNQVNSFIWANHFWLFKQTKNWVTEMTSGAIAKIIHQSNNPLLKHSPCTKWNLYTQVYSH